MLANRNQFPPGGFQFLQPETGWQAPAWMSFDVLVTAVIQHRKANPALVAKHNWPMDYTSVANEVDAFNTQICIAHGWTQFVSKSGPNDPFSQASRSPLRARLAAAAGSVERVAAGVRTLLDWVGKGGKPVDRDVAEKRAQICTECPLNQHGDWKRYFTEPLAKEISLQLEMKNSLKLATLYDSRLNVCTGCDCPLKLKVWAPLNYIVDSMSDDTRKRLDRKCWILSEE
jgi:hypothetical protein